MREPNRLSKQALEAIRQHPSAISLVSFWEVAIKQAVGKLAIEDGLESWARSSGLEIVPLRSEHIWRTRDLPLHHRDPFDRLLIAQAQIEGMTLVSADRALTAYDVPLIRA